MLFNFINNLTWRFASNTGRPDFHFGVQIAPGNNAMGSWTEVIAGTDVEYDVYGIYINLHGVGGSSSNRRGLFDIGIDPTGGSSYTPIIPYLMAGQAAPYADNGGVKGGGISYFFPLFIPAGSSIAARAQTSDGSGNDSGNVNCLIHIFGKPSRPDLLKFGTRVEALGIVQASSEGTPLTPGGVSEGDWLDLGAPSDSAWWAQCCLSTADSSTSGEVILLDLAYGDETNKKVIIDSHMFHCATFERFSSVGLAPCLGAFITPNHHIYMRAQYQGTDNSGLTVSAHLLGG